MQPGLPRKLEVRFAITKRMNTTSKSDSAPTLMESVADMIKRLGEPPSDIWDRLVDDAETRFGNPGLPNDDAASLRSPSHVFWQTHGIDHNGQLTRLDVDESEDEPQAIESEGASEVVDDGVNEGILLSDPVELADSKSNTRKSSKPKLIWIGAVAGVALVGAALYWWPRSSPQVAQSSNASGEPARQHSHDADVFDAGFIATAEDSSMELSTFMDAEPSESSVSLDVDAAGIDMSAAEIMGSNSVENSSTVKPSTAEASGMSSSAFSLDALIPSHTAGMSLVDPENSRTVGDDANAVSETVSTAMMATSDAGPASFGGGEEADVMSDGDEAEMEVDAVTAVTEESIAGDSDALFVSLPAIPSGDASNVGSVSWPRLSLQNAALRFPDGATGFKIVEAQSDAVSIIRPSDETAIAEILLNAEEEVSQFKWLSGSKNADRNSLVHGRMEIASGRHVYMRPSLQSDAIAIDLAERDVKMKWDLSAPPESRQARITMGLRVPDKVDVGWVEPIENETPRKVRGIAVLSQQDSESVAVVVRVDVQTTRMMTVRVRFGARLDPAMPWQWTDRADVSQTLAVVTRQMELADRTHTDLETAISRAESSRARRLEARLDQQLEQLESQQKSLKMFAERLAELDQLIAMLAGQAYLEAELFVSWPDDEQAILQLTSAGG